MANVASVVFQSGSGSAAHSSITATPVLIPADGVSTSTITVKVKDSFGNDAPGGGELVVMATTKGTLGPVIDHGNGTYSAELTSATEPDKATISGTINGVVMPEVAEVTFHVGTASPLMSTISADPTTLWADGISTSTITVRAKDALGNNLSSGGDIVEFYSIGELSPVTDHGDGTYSSVLTAYSTPMWVEISATLNGVPMSGRVRIDMKEGNWIDGLKIEAGLGSAIISWSSLRSDISEIRVYRRQPDTAYRVISRLKRSKSSHEDRGVRPDLRYYFKVEGYAASTGATFTSNEMEFVARADRGNGIKIDPPYPNPSTDVVNISFFLPESSEVSVVVSDMFGRTVIDARSPESGVMSKGWHQIKLDVGSLTSGSYTIYVRTARGTASRSFISFRSR